MTFSRKTMLFAALLISAALAAYGLMPRINAEKENKTVGFVVEYKDVLKLAMQYGKSEKEVMNELAPLGVVGLIVHEYTGDELTLSQTMPLKYGRADTFGVTGEYGPYAALSIPSSSLYAEPLYGYLNAKLARLQKVTVGENMVLVLPGSMEDFRLASIMPDFKGLEFCRKSDIPVLFRPTPSASVDGVRAADALDLLAERYEQIKCIVPAGVIMAGYPDLKPMKEVLDKHGMTIADVEFVRQVGVSRLVSMMVPNVISMHSLTRDEIISRNMSRRQIFDRMVRAAHERSIRLIIMRPYELIFGDRYTPFIADLKATKEAIEDLGYNFGTPKPLPSWPAPLTGAAACALALVFCAWSYAVRFAGVDDGKTGLKEAALLVVASLAVAAALVKVPAAARIAGGLLGGLAATEAALWALEHYNKTIRGLLIGLFTVFACGLAIASFYGTTRAALRLTPFSGVKLTLLLPPLLVLLHDFRRKVHHESVYDILVRPAVWGELVLVGVMFIAIVIVALRSDNVANVPGWEMSLRNFIERALYVRPRTKEFMVGYPALIIYYYVMRKGLAAHYREALRVASCVAFASAINTFCHFHTELTLSIVRVFNGWWLGIIVGTVATLALAYIMIPVWEKGARELFR